MPKGPEVLEELEVEGSEGNSIAIVLLKALMSSTRIRLLEVVPLKPICLKFLIPTRSICCSSNFSAKLKTGANKLAIGHVVYFA